MRLMSDEFRIRAATEEDVPLILQFIKDLAEYERPPQEVVATEDTVRTTLFGSPRFAEVLILEDVAPPLQAAAFALFFHNYSTFLGRPGIYLEDLYVRPEFRGRGFGRALLSRLAEIARERNCGRLEWAVLNWNEPAIGFYKSLGARPMDEWTVFRVTGKELEELACYSPRPS
jgi:GNAT superfamily N-acetyltransferase